MAGRALVLLGVLVMVMLSLGSGARRRHGWLEGAIKGPPHRLLAAHTAGPEQSPRRDARPAARSWRGHGPVPRLRHGHDPRRRWTRRRARRRGGSERPPLLETPLPTLRIAGTLTDILTESEEEYLRSLTSQHHLAAAGEADDITSPHPPQQAAVPTPRQRDPELGIVTKFLQLVESQQRLGENCTAGTDFTLEGVVDRYGQERFRYQAELTVKMANLLTRLWKYSPHVMSDENLLKALVLSLIEADDDIFAAGNCYDQRQYKNYHLFCPFAYRLPEGTILSKDLAVEYDYLSNTSEWYYTARKNAAKLIAETDGKPELDYQTFSVLANEPGQRTREVIKQVTFTDGFWSKPYYDCGGGNIWMMTYTVPFFGFENGTYFFKGTSGIDIDLRRVDIDQCPQRRNSSDVNIFAGSDKCKERTTKCVSVAGLGFRRGSYKCLCRDGFFFPEPSPQRYYNGSVIEDEYEKKMQGVPSRYDEPGMFECLPCAEGCGTCEDGRPCLLTLNWTMRTGILILAAVIIGMLPFFVFFTVKYGEIKVVRAASPTLLRIIILGAFFIYSTTIVSYPEPNVVTCTVRCWLREIGFSLSYGALMLKTWRISVIFRVRSAKAVKITDLDLLKRLGVLVAGFATLLGVRSLVAPPSVVIALSADGLKTHLCHTSWWDHAFSATELLFLVWGIRLCIVVRKAPSEFNESKFISLTIYNEFLLTILLNISTLFLKSPANPDLLYIIFFLHNQLTITVLLVLIFGSKVYMVMKGQGRSEGANSSALKPSSAKFLSSKNSEPLCSNPAPTIAGSGGTLDLFKLADANIQSELDKVTRYLELLLSRGRPLGDATWHAQLEAMLAAARGESAQRAVDRAMQDGLGITPPPKVDSMLAQVTGQLVTTVIRERTAAQTVTFEQPSAPPAEEPDPTVAAARPIGFEGVVVQNPCEYAAPAVPAYLSPVTVEHAQLAAAGHGQPSLPPPAVAEAQVQTCAAGRRQKRHSATQTLRTMAVPTPAADSSSSSSGLSSTSSPSSSASASASASTSSGCGAPCSPPEDSCSACDCVQCAPQGRQAVAVTATATAAAAAAGAAGAAAATTSAARPPPPRRRLQRHRRRLRSLQAIRLNDRARFTEAVTV